MILRAITLFLILILYANCYSQDLNLGKKLMTERKFDEAAVEFMKFKKGNPGFADGQYNLGLISTRKKEFDKAEDFLKQAIALDGNKSEYHIALGSLFGIMAADANPLKQGFLAPKIKNEFEIAARLDPKNIEARWMLINYYVRAPKIMGGDVEKGKTIANEIMKINQAEGNRALGSIWQMEGKNDFAEKYFLASITLAPDSIKYYNALARFYESIPDLGKALDIYYRIINKFPENRQPHLQIGRITATNGIKPDEGEKALNEFISQTSNNRSLANAYYYLGLIEKNRGKTSNAKNHFEMALKLYPDHKPTKEILKKM